MFALIQWNCRSIGNKLHNISLLLALHKPDVVCLQETRLEDHHDPPQFKHYHSYRRHEGHGIAIYTHKSLPQTEVVLNSTLVLSSSSPSVSVLFLLVNLTYLIFILLWIISRYLFEIQSDSLAYILTVG